MARRIKNLEAAWAYLDLGWSPIALCSPNHEGCSDRHKNQCSKPGKAPYWSWKQYQKTPATAQQLESWWAQLPGANVGVAMGPVSKLVAIDIDQPEAGNKLLAQLSRGVLPATAAFTTPRGGYRLLYHVPGEEYPDTQSFRDDQGREVLRILSRGSQTVMPPSMNADGTYTWKPDADLANTPLADAPQWLRRLKKVDHGAVHPAEKAVRRGARYLQKCPPAISGQAGHDTAIAVASKLVKGFAIDSDMAFQLLKQHWNPRCEPPWTDVELRHKIEQALKCSTQPLGAMLNGNGHQQHPPETKSALSVSLDRVQPKKVEWLWQGRLPLGKLVILEGDPGQGKSALTLDLAARVSRGGKMPDDSEGRQGDVLLCCAEDDNEDTIVHRLNAVEARLDRIHSVNEVSTSKLTRGLCLPIDVDVLEALINKTKALLVIFDPLMAFLDGTIDTHGDAPVRQALTPLKHLAQRTGAVLLCVRHHNKSGGTKAIYRGGGSIAFTAAARSVLMTGVNPDNPNERVLAPVKCNLSLTPPSLLYCLESEGDIVRVRWLGPTDHTADRLLASADVPENGTRKTASNELNAVRLLATIGKPMPLADIQQRLGIPYATAKATMNRLKRLKFVQPVEHGVYSLIPPP